MGVEARRHAVRILALTGHVNAYDGLYRRIISDHTHNANELGHAPTVCNNDKLERTNLFVEAAFGWR